MCVCVYYKREELLSHRYIIKYRVCNNPPYTYSSSKFDACARDKTFHVMSLSIAAGVLSAQLRVKNSLLVVPRNYILKNIISVMHDGKSKKGGTVFNFDQP